MHGADGPGPVHLNLEFREPLDRHGSASSGPPGSEGGGPRERDRARPPTTELEPLRGTGLIIAGGPWPQRADPARVGELADRLGWPVLADPLSGSRLEGTIAAADAIVRTEPPLPECIVLLGDALALSSAGDLRRRRPPTPAHGSSSSIRGGSGPTRLRVATEFHQCDVDRLARRRHRDGDTVRSAVARLLAAAGGARRRMPSPRCSGPISASRSWPAWSIATRPKRAPPSWWRRPCRSGISSGTPKPSPTPPRVLANRGVNGIDGVVSTALGVAASGSGQGARTIALMGDLTFLHDVSGLVNLPELPCTFVVLDNGGGGIFSFLPQAPRSSRPCSSSSSVRRPPATSARWRADSACRCTKSRRCRSSKSALAAPTPVARPGQGARPSAERRAARCDQPGGPSRAAVRVGEGVEVERRPVGLWKVSSTLALPEIFHPISCTQR